MADTAETRERYGDPDNLPVVLTPGDPADIRRLAAALRSAPNWTRDEPDADDQFASRVLAALAADVLVDACIYCGCPPVETLGQFIDGDLLRAAVMNACPVVLTGDAAEQIAEVALAALASVEGVTITSGPGSARREPEPQAGPKPDQDLEQLVTERTGKLLAAVTDRDRTITELRAELERANADRQRLAQANENLRGDVAVTAEQRDQWIARHVRAGDALTLIRNQLRELRELADQAEGGDS